MTVASKHAKRLRSQVAWLFLLLFLSSSLFSAVHPLLEHAHEQEVNCDVSDESSCHLKVVHNDLENGCDHQDHLSTSDASCGVCHLIQSQKTEITLQLKVVNKIPATDDFFGPESQSFVKSVSGISKQRGPPAMFL